MITVEEIEALVKEFNLGINKYLKTIMLHNHDDIRLKNHHYVNIDYFEFHKKEDGWKLYSYLVGINDEGLLTYTLLLEEDEYDYEFCRKQVPIIIKNIKKKKAELKIKSLEEDF